MQFLKDESKKQKKIRRAIIIFLIFILVMTFFSKTIMNIFLPEVKVASIEESSVSNSVRISGVVEAVDPYNVKMHGERKIKSVEANLNNYYEEGEVIYYLEDNEEADISEEEDTLSDKQKDYELYILTNDFTAEDKEKIESGDIVSFEEALKKAEALRNVKNTKKTVVHTLKDELDILSAEMEKETLTETERAVFDYTTKITETEHLRDEKQALLDDASDFYEDICEKISEYELGNMGADVDTSNNDVSIPEYLLNDKANTKSSCDGLKDVIKELDNTITLYRYEMEKLTQNEEYQSRLLECSEDSVKYKYNVKTKEYEDAEEEYQDAIDAYDEFMNTTENLINARDMYLDLQKCEKETEQKRKENFGNAVTMPVSGMLTSIPYAAGDSIVDEDIIATIVTKEKGYVLKGTFDKSYVETVSKSTDIITSSIGYYDDLQIEFKKAYYDSDDLSKMIAEYSISADNLKIGDNITLTVLGETQIYPKVVPTTAIREDASGYYVYIFECLSLPFGERYIAKKTPILDVIASNDTNAAIEISTDNGCYVIVDSSKPIDDGEQVRLNNEN